MTKRNYTITCFFLVMYLCSALFYSQENKIDSLTLVLKNLKSDKKRSAAIHLEIGEIYFTESNMAQALDFFNKSLLISEEIGDKAAQAEAMNNIAIVYSKNGNINKCIDLLNQSLKIKKEINDRKGISKLLNNLGFFYCRNMDTIKAIEYYQKALTINEEINNSSGNCYVLVNLGKIYKTKGDDSTAFELFNKSLIIRRELNEKRGIAESLLELSYLAFEKKDFKTALPLANESFLLSKETAYKIMIKNSVELLYKIYKTKGDVKEALNMHEVFVNIKDSITNEKNKTAALQKEFQIAYERKALADSLKASEVKKLEQIKYEQEISKQRTFTYFVIIGFACMLIIALISFKAFKQKQRDNKLISQQKHLVELHQKEIIDSINYAKRIQNAILVGEDTIKKYLPDSFLLYKPKDIVAGDFYWMETVTSSEIGVSNTEQSITEQRTKNSELILIAVADCTGHGVPGAMISVICSNALNRAVKEFGLTDPGKILDKTRELVLDTFSKSDKDVKDGMDISLLSIELIKESTELKKGRLVIPKDKSLKELMESMKRFKVQWAGANSPLWLIKNNEFVKVTANKQAIGKTEIQKPFDTHTFELSKGDALYLFSDGFTDQFGGQHGKKFKSKNLELLISSVSHLSIKEQASAFNNGFETWKGNLEQVDDVTLIGIRL